MRLYAHVIDALESRHGSYASLDELIAEARAPVRDTSRRADVSPGVSKLAPSLGSPCK